MNITIKGVKPYDGTYQLLFGDELTTREWGFIKRLSGYLPVMLDEAPGDPEFACALAVIALRRAGRIDTLEVQEMFDRLIDQPFTDMITLDYNDELEDDAGPPAANSNGNDSASGPGSRTSSATSAATPAGSGTPASASSRSGPPTQVS